MQYILKPGYIFFSSEPTIIMSVLGSSVAITLYHREQQVGGMNHFVHPLLTEQAKPTALYAQPATVQLVRMFRKRGFSPAHLEAQLFGGAAPEGADPMLREIGEQNLGAAEKLLAEYSIPIVGRDVGGSWGRKVAFNTNTGEVIIAKVNRIRESDWFYNPGWTVS